MGCVYYPWFLRLFVTALLHVRGDRRTINADNPAFSAVLSSCSKCIY